MTLKTDKPQNGERLKIFISYSRTDVVIAERFVVDLEENGFEVLIDRRDLPYGEEWQPELADFIRESDTVIWLVSPASVESKWCNWELGEVARADKRLVPVCTHPIERNTLPEALGRIHILPAEAVFNVEQHLTALVDTLNTDRAWHKVQTRLADRARDWIVNKRKGALLLRGASLKNADTWTEQRPKSVPRLPSDVLDLILASRKAHYIRRTFLYSTMATMFGAAALFSWLRYDIGFLVAEAEPVNATISVDGTDLGAHISNLRLASGTHDLQAWAPDHFAARRPIFIPRRGQAATRFWLEQGFESEPYTSPAIQAAAS
jgi:hypothetical protein